MSRRRQERGAALVSVLILSALLIPLGGWVAFQARLDGALARNLGADLHALYVADAGLSHALSVVTGLSSASAVLANTASILPAAPVPFPRFPYAYQIETLPHGSNGIRLRSRGTGFDGTVKQLEAVVVWRDGRAQAWWREDL
jgi:hypothetical protein